jgi:hypothetical protein
MGVGLSLGGIYQSKLRIKYAIVHTRVSFFIRMKISFGKCGRDIHFHGIV